MTATASSAKGSSWGRLENARPPTVCPVVQPHAANNPWGLGKEGRFLAARACLAELAIRCQSWDVKVMEERVYRHQADGSATELTNQFKQTLRGCLPRSSTLADLHAAFPTPWFGLWRDYGLWPLLEAGETAPGRIVDAMTTLGRRMKRHIFMYETPGIPGAKNLMNEISLSDIKEIAEKPSVHAITALTGIARFAQAGGLLRPRYQALAHVAKLFPGVVSHSPHLYLSWKTILRLFKTNIHALEGYSVSLPILEFDPTAIAARLEVEATKARAAGIFLPPDRMVG